MCVFAPTNFANGRPKGQRPYRINTSSADYVRADDRFTSASCAPKFCFRVRFSLARTHPDRCVKPLPPGTRRAGASGNPFIRPYLSVPCDPALRPGHLRTTYSDRMIARRERCLASSSRLRTGNSARKGQAYARPVTIVDPSPHSYSVLKYYSALIGIRII